MNIRLLCTIFFMLLTTSPAAGAARYAVASAPAPVFSSPDAGSLSGRHIQLDSCGQPRGLEFIALPGTTFTITDELRIEGEKIYKVVTGDYPYPSSKGYYLHEKHVLTTDTKPPERSRVLPQADEIVERMVNAVDTPYLWGSNVRDGLKPHSVGSAQASAGLRGIDCSGLLYEATNGYTPRNTSSLSSYGAAVPITGLSSDEIAKKLRPLDLIVWRGHVLIVIGGNRVIESRLRCGAPGNGGVHISNLRERLRAIVKKKKPANSGESDGTFIVRRWFPAVASEGDIPLTYHPVNGFSEKL